ncbi:MAG: M16 family metallopeptidase [Candidatus Limnocylindrales bacterium]
MSGGGTDATRPHAVGSLEVLDRRPMPGQPRPYHFPRFERSVLANGLTVLVAHLPARPLLTAQLLLDGGAATEPAGRAGVSVLAAEALSEGTSRHDAVGLIEATERLGAGIQAGAGWETMSGTVDVPRRNLGPALELLAEVMLEPSFPDHEVIRLREERLNDLLQARADPRRRAERAFAEAIYSPAAPFSRPASGTEETVPALDRAALVERYAEVRDPRRAAFIVAGDVADIPVVELVAQRFAAWTAPGEAAAAVPIDASPNPAGRRVLIVDRPGSPQTEVRIGHVGLPRRIPDYHAVAVLSAILGGLFDSRLQRLLREQRGYTYSVHAGFDLRRVPGPFAVRMAVQTEVTAPAIREALGVLARMRQEPPTPRELDAAREFLIGVFPLRFETASQVVSAIGGLVALGLPDDELDRYRPAIAAVSADEVVAAAAHVHPDEAVVVLVGDATRIVPDLGDAFGPVEVVRDTVLAQPGDLGLRETVGAEDRGRPDA